MSDEVPLAQQLEMVRQELLSIAEAMEDDPDETYLKEFCTESADIISRSLFDRNSILEEAAKAAEQIGESYGEDEAGWLECSETIAQSIRSMKETNDE